MPPQCPRPSPYAPERRLGMPAARPGGPPPPQVAAQLPAPSLGPPPSPPGELWRRPDHPDGATPGQQPRRWHTGGRCPLAGARQWPTGGGGAGRRPAGGEVPRSRSLRPRRPASKMKTGAGRPYAVAEGAGRSPGAAAHVPAGRRRLKPPTRPPGWAWGRPAPGSGRRGTSWTGLGAAGRAAVTAEGTGTVPAMGRATPGTPWPGTRSRPGPGWGVAGGEVGRGGWRLPGRGAGGGPWPF